MFVTTMNKKGYASDLTGSIRELLIIPEEEDDNDTLIVNVKRLYNPITVHIKYVNGMSRILTLNKFNRAKLRVTKQLGKKIDRILIYDTVEEI